MDKTVKILGSFFSKSEYDLDGYHFKNEFKKNRDNILLDVRTTAEHNSGSLGAALHADFLSPSFLSSEGNLEKKQNLLYFAEVTKKTLFFEHTDIFFY